MVRPGGAAGNVFDEPLLARGRSFTDFVAAVAGGATRGVSGNAVWGIFGLRATDYGLLSAVAGGFIAADTAAPKLQRENPA